MRKITFLLAMALIVSCSVDSVETNDEFNSFDAKAKVQNGAFQPPSQICAGVPADFCITAELGTNLQIQKKNNDGTWDQMDQIAQSTSNPQCFELLFEDSKDYELRYKVGRGFSDPVTITVEDCTDCEESFTYQGEGNNYVFTYIPSKDMTNVLVAFTFAQAVATSGFDDSWTVAGQTVQKYMDFSKCETYTWGLELTKDCNASTPNNNIWTDFKVDSESKKGILTNIVQECPN